MKRVDKAFFAAIMTAALSLTTIPPAAMATEVGLSSDLSTATNTESPVSGVNDLDTMTAGIERHLTEGADGPEFDTESALAAGENEWVLEAGTNFNLIAAQHRTEANARPMKIKVPVWGKWCGPGHSGPGEPVDTLDSLCMQHDNCYGERGYFDCQCDEELKAGIDRLSSQMGNKERAMAAAVKMAFSLGLCRS